MTPNVGGIERVLRIVIGVALIALYGFGIIGWWGLIGIIPLATGQIGWSGLYTLLGINTCSAKKA